MEPSFPSRTVGGDKLADLIAAAPIAWLGAKVATAYGGQTPLLVKLLDTADHLSVQVHPAMDDPCLGPDESGKPESWIVLEAEPGAGIYMGLRDGVTRGAVEACLRAHGPLDELLNFVPCQPGDAFVIEAGTVHAIGAGMTLLEPQHVAPGKRGLTYRFWDWNRLYDNSGRRSAAGRPRELHVERSLAVASFQATGDAFVSSCRATPELLGSGCVSHTRLLRGPYFEAESAEGTGRIEVALDTLTGLTTLSGAVNVDCGDTALEIRMGQSAALPGWPRTASLTLRDAHCILTRSR